MNARAHNVPVSGPLLAEKAREIARSFGHDTFGASNGWLWRFKKRNNITFQVAAGEEAEVPEQVQLDWRTSSLPQLLSGYALKDVFNADETDLFNRLGPDRTLSVKGEKCHGGKKSKERLTVLFCSNADGSEKCKPLVIGKFKNPRCFRGVRNLPVSYEANKTAWMTTEIFNKWLQMFDNQMTLQKRQVLLFLDNFSGHKVVCPLGATRVVFFPPNTTSKLQPMDRGIIKNVKHFYRKNLVKRLLLDIEAAGANIPTESISVRDAIDMLTEAWSCVTTNTIHNCFKSAGFEGHDVDGDDQAEIRSDAPQGEDSLLGADAVGWHHLTRRLYLPDDVTFETYADIDGMLATSEFESAEAIVVDLAQEQQASRGEEAAGEGTLSDDSDSEEETITVSGAAAVQAIRYVESYLESCTSVQPFLLSNLKQIKSFVTESALENMTQTTIRDFFKPSSCSS